MTSDARFLKEAKIEPYHTSNWMEWRSEDIQNLRLSLAKWIGKASEQRKRAERWKLIAFAGWMVVLMMTAISIIGGGK